MRERVTRVGPSTVPNRRPPRGRPLRQVGASHIPCLGRRYSGKNAAYLNRVIAIAVLVYTIVLYTVSVSTAYLGPCRAVVVDSPINLNRVFV